MNFPNSKICSMSSLGIEEKEDETERVEEDEDFPGEYNSEFYFVPDEILLHIFGYLQEMDRIRAATTCQRWNRVINDKSLYISPDMNGNGHAKNILEFIIKCCKEDLIMSLTRAIRIAENDHTSWGGPISLTWGTALIAAAENNNIPIARKMIKAGAANVGIRQAISAAIIKGHLTMVKYLLSEDIRTLQHTIYGLYILSIQNKKPDISAYLNSLLDDKSAF